MSGFKNRFCLSRKMINLHVLLLLFFFEILQNGSCRSNISNIEAIVIDYKSILSNDEYELTKAIAKIGPIAVAIDASQKDFRFYSSGIYNSTICSATELNHAVTVVGYGTNEIDQDFYIVKNSWGSKWGDQGYIKMARNKNNTCGIATAASYPIV